MLECPFVLEGKQAIAYYHLTEEYDRITNELFYGGGAGSGKSYFSAYWHLERRLKYPGTRGVVGRQSLQDLKDTWLISLFKLCNDLKLVPGYHFVFNGQSNKIMWYNGSTTILKELKYLPGDKNFDRLGSTEFTDGIIEEAPQIHERAFDVLNSRLRWNLRKHKLVPKMLITGNASDSWVKQKYVCDVDGNVIPLKTHTRGDYTGKKYQQIVLATVKDNPDKEWAADYEQQLDRISSEYDKERLLYGNWLVKPRLGRIYYSKFISKHHCGSFPYSSERTLYHTFDFNKVPYMTSLQIQVEKKDGLWWVYVIDETLGPYPDNRTRPTCKLIMKKFGPEGLNHKRGGFFTGDSMVKSHTTGLAEQYEHEFEIIWEELLPLLSQGADMVIHNKPVQKRRDFVEDILQENGKYPIMLRFDHKCKKLKDDLNFMKQDKDGNKLKEMFEDRDTGDKYQLYGHTSDALEYFLTSVFEDYFK